MIPSSLVTSDAIVPHPCDNDHQLYTHCPNHCPCLINCAHHFNMSQSDNSLLTLHESSSPISSPRRRRQQQPSIALFDFDETMIQSPQPTPENKQSIKQKYGHLDDKWWDSPQSIDPECFTLQWQSIPPCYDFIQRYYAHRDQGHHLFMYTGRKESLRSHILSMLRTQGIIYERAYFVPMDIHDSHLRRQFKVNTIYSILQEFPESILYVYDDDVLIKHQVVHHPRVHFVHVDATSLAQEAHDAISY